MWRNLRRVLLMGANTGRGRLGRALWAVALGALVASACAGSGDDDAAPSATTEAAPATTTTIEAPGLTPPGDEWATATPEEAGFDGDRLAQLAEEAEAAGSRCLAVVRGGRLVLDVAWPEPTAPGEVFSITKSLTAVLVGIAEHHGLLSVDDPVADHVPEWAGTPAEAITIEHLLTNVSGRQWDLQTDYVAMAVQAEDKTAFAIGLEQTHPPGEVWAYNNAAIQVLSRVLESATGVDAATFAERELFEPIGMGASTLGRDPAGNPLTFMGLSSTCADVARMGLLVLHGGRWGDEQLLDPAYVEAATSPATALNAAYGRLFWVNGTGAIAAPSMATTGQPGDDDGQVGQMVPDAPDDAFWALGLQNQVLAVVPSEGLIAVRLGDQPPAEHPFDQAVLTTGVLEALVDR